jgi:glycogen operon protein
MGDEVRQTQGGNNNAYCQDNETSWFDWTLLKKHADVHRFVKLLCARRVLRAADPERKRISLTRLLHEARKAWHGVRRFEPDWGDGSHSLALSAEIRAEGLAFHLILNAYWEPLRFELPELASGGPWRRWIDTGLDSPADIVPWETAQPVAGDTYSAQARSVVMLFAQDQLKERS